MGKFDRFGEDAKPLAIGDRSSRVGGVGQKLSILDVARGAAKPSKKIDEIIAGKPNNYAIALDATGSMSSLIADAKRSVSEIVRRSTKEANSPLRLQLFAFRDYDCGPQVLEESPLSDNPKQLMAWLEKVEPLGGGANGGEAIEAALQRIADLDHFKAVILAGDEPANSTDHLSQCNVRTPTASAIAKRLGQAGTPVHTFLVGSDRDAQKSLAEISKLSGGKAGRLDGSQEMIDMAVMAILSSLGGSRPVRRYMEANALTANAGAFGALLLSGPKDA